MIEPICTVPYGMIAFAATGELTEKDFREVVLPASIEMIEIKGVLNFLMLIDSSIAPVSVGPWWQDALEELRALEKWNRLALLTRRGEFDKYNELIASFIPCPVKSYQIADYPRAMRWVSCGNERAMYP